MCFHEFAGYLYVFFGEMSIQVLCQFLNCVVFFINELSCKSSLYIMDNNSLSDVMIYKYFPYSVDGLFTLDAVL